MRPSSRSIMYIALFLHAYLYCGHVTYNDAVPQSASQEFPFLNHYAGESYITKIANTEGRKPWWQKIRRTPAYSACLEMEHLLESLKEALINSYIPGANSKEPDIALFTEQHLGQSVRKHIETILGTKYQPGIHKKEYSSFMTIITNTRDYNSDLVVDLVQ